ncbi:MAG TPA: UTRA domain-containing protein [Gemmatimonadales bacterium]|nr:UTRA domain-containing protein [Gemmatimonadales bacterium]
MASDEWVSASAPYVAPRHTGASDAWTEESANHGHKGGQKLTFAGEIPAPAEVAEVFGIPKGGSAVVRQRVITLDGEPIELTDTYYPAAIAAGTPLADPWKIKGGAVTLLAQLGHTPDRVHEDVTARMPSAAEREALRLADRDPVLILRRVTADEEGTPIQVDLMTMPARGRHLHYEMQVKR